MLLTGVDGCWRPQACLVKACVQVGQQAVPQGQAFTGHSCYCGPPVELLWCSAQRVVVPCEGVKGACSNPPAQQERMQQVTDDERRLQLSCHIIGSMVQQAVKA